VRAGKFDAGKLVWNHILCNHSSKPVASVGVLKDVLVLGEVNYQCFLNS